jgi:uncharacterized phiE125 gp8 family phage protein
MLKLVTAPTELPLTLEEVKLQLRIDGNEEDALLTGLIQAATEHVQNITNRQLMPATYELSLDRLNASIPLPRPPFAAITTLTAIDEVGQVVEFEADTHFTSDYTSDAATVYGVADSLWFDNSYTGVKVTYEAGYPTAADIPALIKQAMLLIIGYLYNNREDVNDRFPKASENLLNSYRIRNF